MKGFFSARGASEGLDRGIAGYIFAGVKLSTRTKDKENDSEREK